MAEQLKNCFNDEVQQSQLLYGRDTQRIPAKIDFRNNIMPNLLKKEKPSQKLLEESYKKLHMRFLFMLECFG